MVFMFCMLSIPGLWLCCLRRCMSHYLRVRKGLEKLIWMHKEFLLHLHTKPTKRKQVSMSHDFCKSKYGTWYTFETLEKEKKEKKEENHWRKHKIAASFLRCAEIVSFGVTPSLRYAVHASYILVNASFWIKRNFISCFKMLYLKWRIT